MLALLRRLLGLPAHRHPVPAGQFRLVVLNDNPFPDYIGTRAWCPGKLHRCAYCGGRCCDCRHEERRYA